MDEQQARLAAVTDPQIRERLQRRTLAVVVFSQMLGGLGLAAGVTVGALLATELLGSESLGGLPSMLFTLGAALSSYLVGRTTQRFGRRLGLGIGFAAGGIGAIGVVISAALGNIVALFVSLFVYGAGTSTNLQARYAGTDLAPAAQRATAVSIAMVSTTLGAVIGPNLSSPLGDFALSLGLPRHAGPFILAAVAFLAAGTVLLAMLRPDPFLVARDIARLQAAETEATTEPSARRIAPGALVGGAIMVLSQMSMVALMTMTPVHLGQHGHGYGAVGLVIGLHIGAMYLPSLVTGQLTDRVGRVPMAVAGGVTYVVAGLIAALAPGDSLAMVIVSLTLLGVAWNLALVSGTALVVDATTPEERPKTQGSIDVFVSLAGAAGGGASGLIMAGLSYQMLGLVGVALGLLIGFIVVVAHFRGLTSRVRAA